MLDGFRQLSWRAGMSGFELMGGSDALEDVITCPIATFARSMVLHCR